MYYRGKKDSYFRIKCDKCGKLLLFDAKYFIETHDENFCRTNTLIQCSCGNTANGIIKSKELSDKEFHDNNLPKCPTCG